MLDILANATGWLFLGPLAILTLMWVSDLVRSIRHSFTPKETPDLELPSSQPVTRIRLKGSQTLGTLHRRYFRRAELKSHGRWGHSIRWKREE